MPSFKIRLKASIISLFLLIGLPTYGASTLRCLDHLISQFQQINFSGDPFKNSEIVEEKINGLLNRISANFNGNQTLNTQLEALLQRTHGELTLLHALQERLIEEQEVSLKEFEDFHSRVDDIANTLHEIVSRQHSATEITPTKDDLQLDNLINDPTSAQAEKLYMVELVSGEKLAVILSQNIVKEVFSDPTKSRVISRSLRKIQKGIFGGHFAGDGVIRMFIDPTVVEVRASGKDGNFRLFGYLENGNLYLVHYTISSDHGGAITQKNAEKVIGIREIRNQ